MRLSALFVSVLVALATADQVACKPLDVVPPNLRIPTGYQPAPLTDGMKDTLYSALRVDSNYASDVNDRLCATSVKSLKIEASLPNIYLKFEVAAFNVTQVLAKNLPVVTPTTIATAIGNCASLLPMVKAEKPQTFVVTVEKTIPDSGQRVVDVACSP